MNPVERDYLPFVERTRWMPRTAWAKTDTDPEATVAGREVTLSGEPGAQWISGPIPMPLDSYDLRLSVAARVDAGRLGIEWCQAKRGKFHPISWAEPDKGGRARIDGLRAVPTTASFRFVVELAARESVIAIDECRGALEPRVDVLVNQVGYNAGAPKTFVVQANFSTDEPATFRVVAPIAGPGKEFYALHEGTLEPAGPIDGWGRHYWRGEFTALDLPNNYYIEATLGGVTGESPVFSLDADWLSRRTLDPAHRFFWYQRCGMAIPGWHAACHLDDRVTLENGVTIEAAGAWHDAGDYNKYNGFTPLSVYSLLYAHEHHPELHLTWRRTNGRDDILDEAIWGADYLRKVQDPASGKLWGRHFSGYGWWGIPEKETDNRIGDDRDRVAQGESRNLWLVASFAHLGRVLAHEEYIGRALAHWKIAYNGEAVDLGHNAQALFAAHELLLATGDAAFATIAETCAKRIVACQREDGAFLGKPGGALAYAIVDNGLPAAALGFWVRANATSPVATDARRALDTYVGWLRAVAANPFGIGKARTAEADAYFYPIKKDNDWHVGQNSQYLSDAWAAFLVHQVTGNADALRYGLDQVNWVLGMNPYGLSMLYGEGRVQTQTAHHRYNTIVGQPQGAVPGSVFNGICRFNTEHDIPLWDLLPQGTPRYQCNEPWIPHNAYYLFALTELASVGARA